MIRKLIAILLVVLPAAALSAADIDSLRTRPTIWADVTAVGGSAAVNAALTEIFKHSIHAERPDGSSYDSWPSRHTSYAFAILGSVGYRAARYSGWWLVGAHTAANVVAMQRMLADRHYPKDVLGGAATGIVSIAAGEVLSRLIFYGQGPVFYRGDVPERGSVDAFTTAVFPLGETGHGQKLLTGAKAGLRFTRSFNTKWGMSLEASSTSFPLDRHYERPEMLHTYGLAAGATACISTGACTLEPRLMAGAQYNSRTGDISVFSFTCAATCAAVFNISRTCAIGAEAGYELRTMNSLLSSVTLGLFSRVRF